MANNIFKKKDVNLDTFEDLNCKGVIASFSQGDRISDKMLLKLTNDGVPLDLTDATQVRIDFRKPDGKLVFQYCIMEDKPNGLISAILTTQTLAAPGKVYAEVTVKYPEGKDVVTRQFTFHVEEAIAGDKSIESQNEWPMLERAIVAGDMLAGVDLVAIIQAGQLAAAALPKTGGTMTGDLVMSGANKGIQYRNGTNTMFNAMDGNGDYYMFSSNGKTPIKYVTATDTYNIQAANTNVVKKAGDTMTGDIVFDTTNGAKRVRSNNNGVANMSLAFGNTQMWLENHSDNSQVFTYDYSTKTFNVNSNTNLMKKTGDIITGAMTFDTAFTVRGTGASWDMRPYSGSVYSKGVRHTINTANNYYAVAPVDETGAANWTNQMSLYGTTGVFDVKDLNIRVGTASNVVTKLKDGRVTLSLTADATNPVTTNPPRATRRGNTVTVQGSIKRNVGSTGTIVTSLPADMKPTQDSNITVTATDGSAVDVFIGANSGNITVGTADKHIQLFVTYVVD